MTSAEVVKSGDELVRRIQAGDLRDDGPAYELVKLCWRGYPIERLRTLFASTNDDTVEAAAWMLSELGKDARPLLDVVGSLLRHQSAAVRHYALEVVLICATEADSALVADALDLIRDPHPYVRKTVVLLLSRAPVTVVSPGIEHLAHGDAEQQRYASLLRRSGSTMEWAEEVVAADDMERRLVGLAKVCSDASDDGERGLRAIIAGLPHEHEVAVLAAKELSDRERDQERRLRREARKRQRDNKP